MRTRQPISLNVPRFRGAVRALIIINVAIFALQSLLIAAGSPLASLSINYFALQPLDIARGFLWQFLTFQFLHAGTMHIFFNMVSLYMFGSAMEDAWGRNRFLTRYLVCGGGAAVAFCLMSYFNFMGLDLRGILVGASGGVFGIMMAFGMLFANQEVFLFPFPISLKAKYLVGIIIALAFLSLLRSENPGTAVAHLGGALTGFLLVRFGPRRKLSVNLSEGYYGFRNRYQRWKRRRAAKKFEVFMREHDRSRYFDEYGNFRDPSKDDDGKGKDKGGWVN